ncbi:hypothetical protein MMC20_003800 [Loxospora ochrophaea]|nr:hypothetical protein [Loxospora ochrophaea]
MEDCLFLDIYVPVSVLNGLSLVPVVVWFYGGAYVFGSKHGFDISKLPFYSGQGVLAATSEPLIFVAGNYRLGAFGWLAGSYMEHNALPNAGLHDQRKVLEFVQDHIDKVNGNPKGVSVWGESAGAGSILHHLISKDGKQDPLFSRAVLQSPAFEWQWDRKGSLNNTYTHFAELAGCKSGDLSCLQSASSNSLKSANEKLFQSTTACKGVFLVGPSIDGQMIKTLPAVALKTGRWLIALLIDFTKFLEGKFWTKLTSIIISHVNNEVSTAVNKSGSFIPYPIRTDPSPANFDEFLMAFMPGDALAGVRDEITQAYPSKRFKDNQTERVATLIRDAAFTCNTRQLFDAYHRQIPTWMMNYKFAGNNAVHASDLLPTFCNKDLSVAELLENCVGLSKMAAMNVGPYIKSTFSPQYLSYLKSHAIYNDPNTGAIGWARKVTWHKATTSGKEDNRNYVMDVMEPYLPSLAFRKIRAPFQIA